MKRILVAPLNWGLGHATRCMPIINELLRQGAEVILASDGRAYHLLRKEYPQLLVLELPPYEVSYQTANMMLNIAPQLPKIIKAIAEEHKAIQKIVKTHQIDAIISDNRYGCLSDAAYSVFLTHQLNIKIPVPFFKTAVAFFNKQFISRFDECWIPDFEGEKESLSGTLSQNNGIKNISYLGALTRMQHYEIPKKYNVLIILSGPEPQRTILEDLLTNQAKMLPHLTIMLVKGKTNESNEGVMYNNLTLQNYMTSQELNQAILASEVVVTRSGYSTIMDLAVLGKPAILIPTPGQTEQEYLAKRLAKQGIYYTASQKGFDLAAALTQVKAYKGYQLPDNDRLKGVIERFLAESI